MPRPLIGGDIKRCCCLTSVCLSTVAYIGPKSRRERPRKTKIGTEVANVTSDSDTIFKVKGSKVKVTGAGHIVAAPNYRLFISMLKSCQFKTQCKGHKSNIENSTDHFCEDTRQNELADLTNLETQPVPSYPMGPAGPVPGPPSLRGPPNSRCVNFFIS